MDIMLTQMIFANNVLPNAKHAPKLHQYAQVALQIEFFKLIYVTAYLAFMTHQVDVKDVPTNAKLAKILQLNAYHVT